MVESFQKVDYRDPFTQVLTNGQTNSAEGKSESFTSKIPQIKQRISLNQGIEEKKEQPEQEERKEAKKESGLKRIQTNVQKRPAQRMSMIEQPSSLQKKNT